MLEEVHDRLAGVTIEALDYKDFIDRYDTAGTLFYLDPPYYFSEKDYGPELFDRSEFALMAAKLSSIAGKFIISLNDCPEVRKIFSGFHVRQENTTYSISSAGNKGVSEVLISNFEGVHLHKQGAML